MHLWLTPGEANALAVLSDAVKRQGVAWSEHQHPTSFLGLKADYAERLALGNPPTGTHWIASDELRELVDAGVFRLISDAPGKPGFEELLLPEVYEVVSHKGGISALPVGIHLQNHMAYNAKVFRELGLTRPESWEALLTILPRIAQAGYIPVTMSDQRWQLRFLFSAILAAKLTADEFILLVDGSSDTSFLRPKLIDSLTILDGLRPYVNPDHSDLNFGAAVDQLLDERAVISFLSDFTSPAFANDGRMMCASPPGNTYVMWAFDAIALSSTDDPAQLAGQAVMIDVASSKEILQDYVARKGGVPVHVWESLDGINPCSVESVRRWENAEVKIHIGPAWTQSLNIISSVVREYWRHGGSPEQAADEIIKTLNSLRGVSN